MASTEEKLLTLLLSVEHLQHTAMEQQKAVADSLAVARETLRGYRDISDGVAKQVRDEVRNEVQKLDVAGLIGERISRDFQRLEGVSRKHEGKRGCPEQGYCDNSQQYRAGIQHP